MVIGVVFHINLINKLNVREKIIDYELSKKRYKLHLTQGQSSFHSVVNLTRGSCLQH
jgi:hypothetical protein